MTAGDPLRADELTIQRIATARATKAVRLIYALMSTAEPIDVPSLSEEQREAIVQRAGVKTASPLTWKVVQATIEGIVAAAREAGTP